MTRRERDIGGKDSDMEGDRGRKIARAGERESERGKERERVREREREEAASWLTHCFARG